MLSSGTKLGPYEIQDLLGAGGMGEVYRARDPRIGREVAIKILPSSYSEDSNRLTRFEQEARATGLLNHPNILAIYDVGTENGSPYLVSELLEGETLRNKLEAGPLTKRKAIDYAQQITKGLAAAHEKGIIHRDLKPENLFITKDGRLKILDFGLAKLILPEPVNPGQSSLQTASAQSIPGLILGTAGYMSPEQVRGRPADQRSDIFTFGAILYEMLTAKRAFHGETIADMMSSILQKDPVDLSQKIQNVPPGLQRIMERCMEKDPEERFQSARDLTFALEAISGSSDTQAAAILEAAPAAPSASRNRKLTLFLTGAASLLFATSLIFGVAYFRNKSQQALARPIQFEIFPKESVSFFTQTAPQVSPDGRLIHFQATDSAGSTLLFVRDLNSFSLKRLPGTDGALNSFWSPDSRSIAFFAQGKLRRIDLQGGAVQDICDSSPGRGGTWNRDNIIVFSPASNSALVKVSASGGQPQPVTQLSSEPPEYSHRYPQFLPDGKHFLFLSLFAGDGADAFFPFRDATNSKSGIYVGSLDSKEKKFLLSSGTNASFAQPKSLFFVRQSTLMVQSFDPDKMQLQREARPIVQQVGFVPTGQSSFSTSENGVLAYRARGVQQRLTLVDREGKTIGSVGPVGDYDDPALSPDGKRLAVTRGDIGNAQNVWVYDFNRNTFSRFTFNPVICDDPVWSADGQKIVYSGEGNIYMKSTGGAQQEKLLYKNEFDKVPLGWSADGQTILFSVALPKTSIDISLLSLEGKPSPLLKGEFNETHVQLSPDGRWIAYSSDESGGFEVYVQSFPELSRGKWQISSNGGVQPRWRKDGKELFYFAPDGTIVAVPVLATTDHFEAGTPQPLFKNPQLMSLMNDVRRPAYDVFPDGQRFLINMQLETDTAPISVILNWPALLPK